MYNLYEVNILWITHFLQNHIAYGEMKKCTIEGAFSTKPYRLRSMERCTMEAHFLQNHIAYGQWRDVLWRLIFYKTISPTANGEMYYGGSFSTKPYRLRRMERCTMEAHFLQNHIAYGEWRNVLYRLIFYKTISPTANGEMYNGGSFSTKPYRLR
jgi:hypothetical protein